MRVQDAFLQVWHRAATFDPARGSAKAWLVSIVRYRALDAAQKRSREILTDDPGLADGAEDFDPVAALAARRDGNRLHACLETLEERNRRAILLAFVDGLTHSEIAERITTPLGTVKAWIRRGLAALKTCLEA
ncbi:MAG: sigma-70 family RNA polymerase sigma factor [Aliidongia sp.]